MDILKEITLLDNIETGVESIVSKMNQNQVQDLLSALYGQILWSKSRTTLSRLALKQLTVFQEAVRYVVTFLKTANVPLEMNANGIRIDRSYSELSVEHFGQSLLTTGNWYVFKIVDSSHCYWFSQSNLKIICYCEGDIITRTAINNEMLCMEMTAITKWHKENH